MPENVDQQLSPRMDVYLLPQRAHSHAHEGCHILTEAVAGLERPVLVFMPVQL